MQGKRWLVALLLLGAILVPGAHLTYSQQDTEKKTFSLRVFVPQVDTEVKIDNRVTKSKGTERLFEVTMPKQGEVITVKATWKPNNYTEITRTKKLTVKPGGDFEADLREADPKNPDNIEVIFVPTPDDVVERMCKLGRVTKSDIVYDLGCGDGRMVVMAVEKFMAKRGVGIDLNPERVKESKDKAKEHGVADRVEFRQGNVLEVADLSDATVVLLYMGEDINKRLKPILKKTLKPGSRVVSHRFLMGDDWKPDKTENFEGRNGFTYDLHLWEIKGDGKKENKEKAKD